MNDWVRKAGAVAVALVLVTTAALSGAFVPKPAVETAEAAYVTDCDAQTLETAFRTVVGGKMFGSRNFVDNVEACSDYGADQQTVEGLSKSQAYAHTLAIKDEVGLYNTTVENRLSGTRSLAYAQAKVVAINELNNGSSKSTVKNEVNETIKDFYSAIQANVIAEWNVKVDQVEYLNSTSLTVDLIETDGTGNINTGNLDFKTTRVELINGSKVEYRYFADGTNGYGMLTSNDTKWRVRSINPDDGSENRMFNFRSDFSNRNEDIKTQRKQVRDNMGTLVDNIYAKWSAGEINTTELYDPISLSLTSGTDWNSTGSQSFAAVELALLGHAGNVNTTATISTNKSAATYDGTLFYTADDLPNGTIKANTTYDLANLNGSFVMAVQGDHGNAWVEEWSNAKVTIEELRDAETGKTVNKTIVKEYTQETTNASALRTEINRLKNLTEYYRQQSNEGTATGGFSLSGDGGLLLGAGVAGAAVLYGISNSGGSGGSSGGSGGTNVFMGQNKRRRKRK